MEQIGEEEISSIFGTEPITTFCVVSFSTQTIPSTLLAEFLRKHLIIDLVCCTDDGMSWTLKVIKLHDPYKTKLGYTWMQLC
ncbi:hypothetical protein QL285_062913 [Trifolium repens]|nr:hypothetical protein QL285_062913 [Trifolium repens]